MGLPCRIVSYSYMNLLLIGITLGTIGKLLLGVAVLRVHLGILHEHKIDEVVLNSIKREQTITLAALALILVGFLFEILFYAGSTDLLTCVGSECANAAAAAFAE